jgi:Cu/Ag efflux protein CusF
MRRSVGILATTIAPFVLAGVALAADPSGVGGAASHAGSAAASGVRGAVGSAMGEHQISGTIKSIDKDEGKVTFESTDGKEMELYFPRTALQNLNEGERVTLQMAIRPSSSGATSGAGSTGSGSRGTGSMGTGGPTTDR